jgi:ribonuclease BN (tRNA processing enzyme)
MELVVAGAGPAYSDRRGSVGAGYVLIQDGRAIVLDLGHGAYAGVAETVEPADLDGVVISHLHPDHFVDLVALRHYLRYEFEPPRRVRVLAPAGLDRRLDDLNAEPGFTRATLDLDTLSPGRWRVGPFDIEAQRVTHTDDSYGFRVTPAGAVDGTALVYSGDCGRGEDLLPLVRPGDALLIEASFGTGPVPVDDMHLDGPTVARIAAASGAGRVLLTHVLAAYDRAAVVASVRAGFAGPIAIVEPGDRFTV